MKNHLKKILLLSMLSVLLLPSFIFAGTQHSLGVDLIRTVDQAQYDALFNIHYQFSLNQQYAVISTLSADGDTVIGEVGAKYYFEKYFDGPFAQVGINMGDYDGDFEMGVSGAVGYEKSIIRHLVVSCAVEMVVGTMDHPTTGDRDPLFRPVLNVIFAF